jgi:hypothetical protein
MIEIVKWSETFENAAGRKLETLHRFDHPAGCNSRGYRKLARDGVLGMAAFGVFNALCQLMADSQKKAARKEGIFRNGDGSLMEIRDIIDLTWLRDLPDGNLREALSRLVAIGWIKFHTDQDSNDLPITPPVIRQSSATDMPAEPHSPPSDPPPSPANRTDQAEQTRTEHPPIVPQKGDGEEGSETSIFPKGSRNLSTQKQKLIRVLRNTAMMIRVGGWFDRRATTLWTVEEGLKLEAINPTADDLEELESYYLATDIPAAEDYRRRDLPTLLNNWTGEMDRAAGYTRERKGVQP